MKENLKKYITIENFLYLFLIICPILDVSSFLFRNHFNTNFSISTFVRPIIPIIIIIYLFFKDNIKKKLIIGGAIYFIYAIIHIIVFKNIVTDCAYGNIYKEIQYLINYTFMIMNLFIYIYIFIIKEKDKETRNKNVNKFKITILITFTLYIVLMYIAILMGTSSYTYSEDQMGYKGWFESGNSVGAIMILSLCIVLPMIKCKNMKIKVWAIVDIILSIMYLTILLGTRVGLVGSILTILTYIVYETSNKFISKKKFNRRYIVAGLSIFAVIAVIFILLGSATIQRRKLLQSRESIIYDQNLGENAHVTGDILGFIPQIENHTMSEKYMSYSMQKSILDLYNYNNIHNISSTNMRMIQFIYHAELVKNQRSLVLMLFGNGYMTHYYELIFEMEVPAFMFNFGIFGFILYFMPFLMIVVYSIKEVLKRFKEIKVELFMGIISLCFAILSSFLAGYTFFSSSTTTIIIAICVMVLNDIKEMKGEISGKNNIWNN